MQRRDDGDRPTRSLRATNGLPTGPRSRSVGRPRREETYLIDTREKTSVPDHVPSSRQVRPQRYIASISSRDRSQPPPSSQSRQQLQRIDTSAPSSLNRRELSSSTSTSSSASSFMDRMRSGGSSRTSWEEDRDQASEANSKFEQYNNDVPNAGHGQTLWERLANAAGSLNIDVGKAWVATLTIHSGEETPPNQESRLTRAMKAYHLSKARSPTDLPEWLFDHHERHPYGHSHSDISESETARRPSPAATRTRGLRGIYDAAAASSPNVKPKENTSRSRFADEHGMESKATDRLNALRDARRHHGRSDGNHPMQSDTGMSNRNRDRAGRATYGGHSHSGAHPPPRVGLPTRPGRI